MRFARTTRKFSEGLARTFSMFFVARAAIFPKAFALPVALFAISSITARAIRLFESPSAIRLLARTFAFIPTIPMRAALAPTVFIRAIAPRRIRARTTPISTASAMRWTLPVLVVETASATISKFVVGIRGRRGLHKRDTLRKSFPESKPKANDANDAAIFAAKYARESKLNRPAIFRPGKNERTAPPSAPAPPRPTPRTFPAAFLWSAA